MIHGLFPLRLVQIIKVLCIHRGHLFLLDISKKKTLDMWSAIVGLFKVFRCLSKIERLVLVDLYKVYVNHNNMVNTGFSIGYFPDFVFNHKSSLTEPI